MSYERATSVVDYAQKRLRRIYPAYATVVVVLFCGLFDYLGRCGRHGDFSYGLYILHFPLIQVLLHTGWFSDAPGYFLATVVLTSMAGAVALWHGIEKRWLLRNNHYVAVKRPSPARE